MPTFRDDHRHCYHCRREHPLADMREIQVNGRTRWRCLRSIVGAAAGAAQRDAFGRTVGAMGRRLPEPPPHCVRELFSCHKDEGADA